MILNRSLLGSLLGLSFVATLSCSPKASQQYLKPNPPDDKVEQGGEEEFNPLVDILFVVDNSGSMDTHQRNLASNISIFTAAITGGSSLDFNVGVVSSTPSQYGSAPCCGQLYGTPTVVTKATPFADQALQRNIVLGTNGDGYEEMFGPVVTALSPPNINTWNAGFLRAKATIAVIFITDAEDQSRQTPQQTHQFLLGLKSGNADKVLAYGVFIPSTVTGCTRDDAYRNPIRIEQFLALFPNRANNVMNLCAPDYGKRLGDLAKDIVKFVGRTIYLKRAPDLSSVRITFGNLVLPMDEKIGWIYDIEKNAIILGEDIDWGSQPVGSKVKVFYNAAKYDEENL